ncbi:hypothetical protein DSO57_1030493 [Entomophthora muscae]|uniref:Uncharacterized protein n=1 Tax=Entomophthora muscae TaxID=34485 RepID=A0ACC2TZH1_9FUNG|nr:hypothetical protein DSO57_1030493 [Entomophthora muscae]
MTPALPVVEGAVLAPKSYAQALSQKCLSSQSKNGNQIENDPMTPAANPVRTNDQSSKDRPPASQAAVPEDPKNNGGIHYLERRHLENAI